MREFYVDEGESLHRIFEWMDRVKQPAKIIRTMTSKKLLQREFIIEFTEEFKEDKHLNPDTFVDEGFVLHQKLLMKSEKFLFKNSVPDVEEISITDSSKEIDKYNVNEYWIPVKEYLLPPEERL